MGQLSSAILGAVALAFLGSACAGGSQTEPEPLPPQCSVAADCAGRLAQTTFDEACTETRCVEGQCRFSAGELDGSPCEDANACTSGDACLGRQCVGEAANCDDGDFCTLDTCDPATGECGHAIDAGALCNDDVACTSQDRCTDTGACRGKATSSCECLEDADCAAQVSADLCDGALVCLDDYRCGADPTNAVVCDDAADSTCRVATCLPESGKCELVPRGDGAACGPADDPCVVEGVCDGGACAGTPVDCDDNNVCTVDTCSSDGPADAPCKHTPASGSCDDGDACTVGDTCDTSGACAGSPKPCNDGKPCTSDACDPESGGCVTTPIVGACDDANPCTVEDVCGTAEPVGGGPLQPTGTCAGTPMDCDDGTPCTVDSCKSLFGEADCQHQAAPGPCDDGQPCTTEDFCLGGACRPGTDVCECIEDVDCAPGAQADPCGGERACDLSVFPHTCAAVPGTAVVCDPPDNPCLKSACAPLTGLCEQSQRPEGSSCDDGNACTSGGLCQDALCVPDTYVTCGDGLACTSDRCVEGTCVFEPLDGAAVFVSADFDAGLPEGWTATTTNPAGAAWGTDGAFDVDGAGQGAVVTGPGGQYGGPVKATLVSPEFVPVGAEVSLSFSSLAEVAQPGCGTDRLIVSALIYGSLEPLGQLCATTAAWTPRTFSLAPFRNLPIRLVFTFEADASNNAGFGFAIDNVMAEGLFSCSDGDACTDGDGCVQGLCEGSPRICDDGDTCTADSCDSSGGACVFEDLPACVCAEARDCPDLGACVQTTCEGGFCVDTPVAGACDDGDACTGEGTCSEGICEAAAIECSDGDPCTQDLCDPLEGCQFPPADGVGCDDEDPCTVADTCQDTVCAGTPKDCSQVNPCLEGLCVSGDCLVSPLHDGQQVSRTSFDTVGPGTLPAGWTSTSSDEAWSWKTALGANASAPNALAAQGPDSWDPVVLTASSPPIQLPPDGGRLNAQVSAVLASAGCAVDVLRVKVGEVPLSTICSSTGGFQPVLVDLGAFGGQEISLQFELTLGAGVAGNIEVRLDEVIVTGRFLCDDGDACTSSDRCVLGTCGGNPLPDCP